MKKEEVISLKDKITTLKKKEKILSNNKSPNRSDNEIVDSNKNIKSSRPYYISNIDKGNLNKEKDTGDSRPPRYSSLENYNKDGGSSGNHHQSINQTKYMNLLLGNGKFFY